VDVTAGTTASKDIDGMQKSKVVSLVFYGKKEYKEKWKVKGKGQDLSRKL
jgi:hypothetical protein